MIVNQNINNWFNSSSPKMILLSILLLSVTLLLSNTVSVSCDRNFFIVGGVDAEFGSVPWTASLRYAPADTIFGAAHFCGGTLISNRTILTATHCLANLLWVFEEIYLPQLPLNPFQGPNHKVRTWHTNCGWKLESFLAQFYDVRRNRPEFGNLSAVPGKNVKEWHCNYPCKSGRSVCGWSF